MIFTETKLKGAFVIEPERFEDERGFFARTWCQKELVAQGLDPRLVQMSIVFSKKKGTLRGMHYQVAPYEEVKIARCTRGAIYNVIIDLRLESPTFKEYLGIVLSAENRAMLYVPTRFAQGYQTLEDDTEVMYQMSEFYAPECARGVRWNDPAFGIVWPGAVHVISERDRNFADFSFSF